MEVDSHGQQATGRGRRGGGGTLFGILMLKGGKQGPLTVWTLMLPMEPTDR